MTNNYFMLILCYVVVDNFSSNKGLELNIYLQFLDDELKSKLTDHITDVNKVQTRFLGHKDGRGNRCVCAKSISIFKFESIIFLTEIIA